MNTRSINLFVYDQTDNFEKTRDDIGKNIFKKIESVNCLDELNEKFKLLDDDEYVYLVVHASWTKKIKGIKGFLTSGIAEDYKGIGVMYISEGDDEDIENLLFKEKIGKQTIYKYHEVSSSLKDEKFKVHTKREILDLNKVKPNVSGFKYEQIDYAIITALYNDEFQELEKVFDFSDYETIKTPSKHYRIGYLKGNRKKKVVAAVPNLTGMVDSSIIATQMIEFFRPNYILMSGVCGGADGYDLGDIIIAKQIFTFQKGKISDVTRINEEGKKVVVDLFDKDGAPIDYTQLYDNDGKAVFISVEKFEIELESVIDLQTGVEDALNPHIKAIEANINNIIDQNSFFLNKKVKIYLEPMACSMMVINKKGYFEDTIKSVNRKTAAVEMESYGVARACRFANDGKTIPIIFKSVMDHTHMKEDVVNGINYKKFAAFTSAQFMRSLLERNVI